MLFCYTGKNVTKKHGRPYLLYSSSEINMLANSMGKYLCLLYTTNQCFPCIFHRPPMIMIKKKMIDCLEKGVKYT